jgi:hypothetical protein
MGIRSRIGLNMNKVQQKTKIDLRLLGGMVALGLLWQANAIAAIAPAKNLASTQKPTFTINLRAEERHGDYLNAFAPPPKASTINEYFFDSEIRKDLEQRYTSMTEHYEFKKNYGIDGWEDHYNYQNANRDLADYLVRRMTQHHIEKSMKNSDKTSSTARAVTGAVRTAQSIQNTSISINEKTKARFRYDFPRGRASFGFTSPYVDSSFDYVVRPMNQQQPTPGMVQQEKLSASVQKELKDIGASGGARYGLTNKTVNYFVSKHLAGPFSAQVDQVDRLGQGGDETIGRLNFGIGF